MNIIAWLVLGAIAGYPTGHEKIYMRKRLDSP